MSTRLNSGTAAALASSSAQSSGASPGADTDRATGHGIRARARRGITAAIKASARRQLAESGADGLSLRAIARELEMASSAIYRYFASRDELLTALVVDAYNSLGTAAEDALSIAVGQPAMMRWTAVCRSLRTWALRHRAEYSLIYGTPVPGYVAPTDTVAPASRAIFALAAIVIDVHRSGIRRSSDNVVSEIEIPVAVRGDMADLRRELGPDFDIPVDVADGVMAALIVAWASLFGLISLELFGQFHGVVAARDEFFDHAAMRLGRSVGIPG